MLENSSGYSDTTSSLWSYSEDNASSFNLNITNTNVFKSFKYKAINYW